MTLYFRRLGRFMHSPLCSRLKPLSPGRGDTLAEAEKVGLESSGAGRGCVTYDLRARHGGRDTKSRNRHVSIN